MLEFERHTELANRTIGLRVIFHANIFEEIRDGTIIGIASVYPTYRSIATFHVGQFCRNRLNANTGKTGLGKFGFNVIVRIRINPGYWCERHAFDLHLRCLEGGTENDVMIVLQRDRRSAARRLDHDIFAGSALGNDQPRRRGALNRRPRRFFGIRRVSEVPLNGDLRLHQFAVVRTIEPLGLNIDEQTISRQKIIIVIHEGYTVELILIDAHDHARRCLHFIVESVHRHLEVTAQKRLIELEHARLRIVTRYRLPFGCVGRCCFVPREGRVGIFGSSFSRRDHRRRRDGSAKLHAVRGRSEADGGKRVLPFVFGSTWSRGCFGRIFGGSRLDCVAPLRWLAPKS